MATELLTVYAKPGSRTEGIYFIDETTVKVEIRTKAEKGRANKEIIRLISETFDIPKISIDLVRGQTASIKHFEVPQKVFDKIPALPSQKKS